MIYEKELKHFRRTNFCHPKGLLTFPAQKPPIRPKSISEDVIKQIRFFTNNIHGVCYIWGKDLCLLVRLFWLLLVAAAVSICFSMYLMLSSQYTNRQLKTVVGSSQMSTCSINFPAVALCPWIHVNWMRHKAAQEKFLPPAASNRTKGMFYDLLRVLDEMELTEMDSLALLDNYTSDRDLNKIVLKDLVHFMAFRCEEIFVECYYDETKYDCCKIFVGERTAKGICMVFNSMVSEDSKKKQITDKSYPWNNRKAGEGSGIQFTLRYNKTFQAPQTEALFGIHVMVKQSEAWSNSFSNYFVPNAKSYLSITPILTETSLNTRHLDQRKRNCLFPDEKSKRYDRIENLPFNKLNCIVKCQQTNFIKICNCSLSWFFPEVDVRDCRVSDFKCIYDNRDIFTYIKSPLQDDFITDMRRGVVCDCVPSCTSLVFLTDLRVNQLANINASYTLLKGDIYIGQNVYTKYETRLHYTAFDLIAKFGGILGLCMGASVLSLAEIVYAALKVMALFVFGKLCQQPKVKPYPKQKSNKKSKEILMQPI